MKIIIALALPFALFVQGAAADGVVNSSSGAGALALAALVGAQSPLIGQAQKQALKDMLNGDLAFPADAQIVVAADSVSCRASDVDISAHSCTFKFGATTLALSGREAHELYATLIENGVPSDGAAGSIYEAVSHLNCVVKPSEVKQRAGGGASCKFSPGP